MALSREEILRLGELARLELTEDEIERQSEDLEKILGYVGRLSAIDTTGVSETTEGGLVSPPAEDVAKPVDIETREFIIMNFPDRVIDALRVPAVFDKPKS